MSFSLNSLLNYFPQIKEYYDISSQVYSLIGGFIDSDSKIMDCDVYFPSSVSILNKSEIVRNKIQSIQTRGFDITPLIQDDIILENFEISSINQRINEQFKINLSEKGLDLSTFRANDIRNLTDDVTRPCPPILKPEDLESIKQLDKLKQAVQKEILEDDQFMDFLDKCRTKNRLPDTLKEMEKFTLDEIKEVAKDCFDPSNIDSNFNEPDGDLSNNLSDLSSNVDPNEDPDFTPPISFAMSESDTQVLLTALGEKADCFSVMNEIMEEMKTLSNEYTEHMLKKPDLERDYVYYTIYYNMFSGLVSGIKDKNLIGGILTSPTIDLYDSSVLDYSKEIKRDVKTIQSKYNSLVKYKIGDLVIKKINKPDKSDGQYFKPYFDVAKTLEQKKFKEGKASQQEYDNVDKKARTRVLKDLDDWVKIVKQKSKSEGSKIYRTLTSIANLGSGTPQQLYKEVLGILEEYLDKYESLYLKSKSEYFNFEKKSNQFIQDIRDVGKRAEDAVKTLGCEPPVTRESDIEEEFDEDFRGVPDPSKPTIYDKDYWKKFAKLATRVGLTPIPQFFGSNDFQINVGNPSNPKIKLPGGSIAIDDDGIPRFLFWPIGLLIPTPLSADGLYRIPLPMIWNHLFMLVVEDPLRKLHEKLVEFTSKLNGFEELRNIITPDDTLDQVWKSIPNGNLDSLLSIMGLNNQAPFVAINTLIAQFTQNLKNQLSSGFEDVISKWDIDSEDWDYNTAVKDLDSLIERKRNSVQGWVDDTLNKQFNKINELAEKLDLGDGARNIQSFIAQAEAIIQSADIIMRSFTSCFNLPETQDDASQRLDGASDILNKAKQYSSAEFDPRSYIGKPSIRIPYLSLSDYLFVLRDTLRSNIIKELQEEFDIYKLFPKLKFYVEQIKKYIKKYYYKWLKYKLWDIGFDPRSLINLNIPSTLLSNFSLLKFDFPELIFSFFIGQCGVFPYPFMLAINNSNKGVPGVIDERTIEFIITLDIKNPIKVIKKNFGSYTVPLKTQIETILNQSLGLYYDPIIKIPINLCSILELKDKYVDIISDLKNTLTINNLKKSLYNSLDYPNPNIICKLAKEKEDKKRFNILLGSFKLRNSVLPPKLTKLSGLTRYGLTDYDGDLVIDELKRTFDVTQFPSASEILGYTQPRNTRLLFSEMGMASKVLVDLIPSLTAKSPYIQDDLPSWERLNLGNIPFIFFLGEFLVAAKRGAKLPIPEINPALEM